MATVFENAWVGTRVRGRIHSLVISPTLNGFSFVAVARQLVSSSA